MSKKIESLLSASILDLGTTETCRKKFNELLLKDEVIWKQRSKEFYVKEGDKNTKFFHLIASKRRKNNGIVGIEYGQGIWHNDPHMIEEVLLSYFQEIFTTFNPCKMDEIFQGMPKKVSEEHRRHLDKEFSEQEIKEALF